MPTSVTPVTTKPVPMACAGSLIERAESLESEMAEFHRLVKQVQAKFETAVSAATLRSRKQTAKILNASTDQVGRWTSSGQLRVVDLDRRPRYRLEDIEAFGAARVRRAMRLQATGGVEPSRADTGKEVAKSPSAKT